MHSERLVQELEKKASDIRKTVVTMIYEAQTGHPGGSLSAADILTCLYYHHMNIDPENPEWEDRDRLILSKGHAAPTVYAILGDMGFFPREELKSFRQIGSILQGHPDRKKTPGIEMTAGSLGQGLSAAIGLALGAKLNNKKYRSYAYLGDGELNEGQIWEAVMYAYKEKLDNLVAIVDYNGVQLDGCCRDIMPMTPMKAKWEAFGWRVLEVNGHNVGDILDVLEQADLVTDGPVVIIADTIKGRGVSFMQNDHRWHGQSPTKEQYEQAIQELERGN